MHSNQKQFRLLALTQLIYSFFNSESPAETLRCDVGQQSHLIFEQQHQMGNSSAKYDFETGLSDSCWELVISYLDVISQVRLAQVSKRLYSIFRNYAKRRYKHLDEKLIQMLSAEELEQLLQLIGDQVQSYVKYSCGHAFEQLYRRHFEIIVRNCKHLERFALYKVLLCPELMSQLSQLQHLWLRIDAGALRSRLLESLIPLQLEVLVLRGPQLNAEETKYICNITSLKELDICCAQTPIEQFLKLQQLEKLHMVMPWITDDQFLALIKGLQRLQTIYVRKCPLINEQIVSQAYAWISANEQRRHKLQISLHKSAIKMDFPDDIISEKN
ncbi:uncharacterized protein LOC115561871 [Drosophila navojoa]|uniref:uncharacterized protein LOC115561871 n=1 Tax=Drosophila navojoa TaxID=7232 RepID=UPI0011BE48B7|nr:uncharacterized protein LOC115561871 [Drosophila navojoa]